MVAMMTATTGRPSRGRNTTRSKPKLKTIMTTSAATTPPMTGMPLTPRTRAATKPASITNSPCAKLMASVAL
jgi:hypothetical protein